MPPRLVTAVLLLLVALSAANAQDNPSPAAAQASAVQKNLRHHYVKDAGEGARIASSLFPKAPPPGKLTRFTRLAGMFMGRVPMAVVGDMRVCLKLEIK